MKILIVDDATFFRLPMRRALETKGFQVVEATSAEDGLRLYLTEQPDLVITDYLLPDNTGVWLFKSVPNNKKVPFFLISHKPEVLDSALKDGFVQALAKPVDMAVLGQLVCDQLSLSKKGPPKAIFLSVEATLYELIAEAAKKDQKTIQEFLLERVKKEFVSA